METLRAKLGLSGPSPQLGTMIVMDRADLEALERLGLKLDGIPKGPILLVGVDPEVLKEAVRRAPFVHPATALVQLATATLSPGTSST